MLAGGWRNHASQGRRQRDAATDTKRREGQLPRTPQPDPPLAQEPPVHKYLTADELAAADGPDNI